jgi:DNA invertase Pin-like site-specific DNA recombinase
MLMRLVRSDRVAVVLCANFNGLGRSVSQLMQMLREFVAHKVTLIIPGRINTSKVPSKVFLDMLDAIEEFKRAATAENIAVGLARARRRGVKLGRPETVNRHRGDVAKLRVRGLSGRTIGKELGVPSSTVFKVLSHL